MNLRLISLFDKELNYLRQSAGAFAKINPVTAERLSLNGTGLCDDPHVERLLEGVAYLTARVQLELEAEFPRLTQGLLETVYPHFVAPVPSMAIVQLAPTLSPDLISGPKVPRDTI